MKIEDLKNKNVHIIGVSGSEGSSILSFLLKHNIRSIICHDFIEKKDLEINFKKWHKGISSVEKEQLWNIFSHNIENAQINLGANYLQDIESADFIFTPQSWRLYDQNKPLEKIFSEKEKVFYSLARLYLDYSKATLVGVTGTVGKGSTANILSQILRKYLPHDRKVYFGGNETWMVQIADKLDDMQKKDIFILEISHRQLIDGIGKGPHIAIFTNLYPNHLDEINWDKYKKIKFSLLEAQRANDYSILNFDQPVLAKESKYLRQKIFFFSENNRNMNTKDVQQIYDYIMNTKSVHYIPNLLAASTAAHLLGIKTDQIIRYIPSLRSLPARLELIASLSGVKFYDDIKSTTPWATLKALDKIGKDTILICGGDTKGINYDDFFSKLQNKCEYAIVIKSQLNLQIPKDYPHKFYAVSSGLKKALTTAYGRSHKGVNILISPAAGFFYTKFIDKQSSIKKIITSLPPRQLV